MNEKARLKWHCRRGMRELDLLLEEFLEDSYQGLSATERGTFARLLDCPNQDLMAWLIDGDTPPDEELAGIVEQVRGRTKPKS